MEEMTSEWHVGEAENLMTAARANLGYGDERKVEKALAQATLARAHIDMARLKVNG